MIFCNKMKLKDEWHVFSTAADTKYLCFLTILLSVTKIKGVCMRFIMIERI